MPECVQYRTAVCLRFSTGTGTYCKVFCAQEYIIETADAWSMRSWLTAIHACMRGGSGCVANNCSGSSGGGDPATITSTPPPALLPRIAAAAGGGSTTADRMFRLGLTESQSLQVSLIVLFAKPKFETQI
jgi:hypothetical protein